MHRPAGECGGSSTCRRTEGVWSHKPCRNGGVSSGEAETARLGKRENRVGRKRTIPDFADIRGQGHVKRAAEIAVAGGHNLLMIGPPGSGKSMTARCIAGILPPLDFQESLEITKIYSVLGMVDEEHPLITRRPFRRYTIRRQRRLWSEAGQCRNQGRSAWRTEGYSSG